jgi:hypothetical protein
MRRNNLQERVDFSADGTGIAFGASPDSGGVKADSEMCRPWGFPSGVEEAAEKVENDEKRDQNR